MGFAKRAFGVMESFVGRVYACITKKEEDFMLLTTARNGN